MPIAAPIVAAGISAGTSIFNAISQGSMNRKSRKWNEKMYGLQRQHALEDYATQNRYNTPAAQMQRYKDAGLNPHLIYGQSNEGGTVRSTDSKSWNPRAPEVDAAPVLDAYYNAKLKPAQVDLINAQKESTLLEAVLKQAQALKTNADTDNVRSQTRKTDTETSILSKTGLQHKIAEINKLIADTEFTIEHAARENIMFAPRFSKAVLDVAHQELVNANTREMKQEILARVNNILADTRVKNADANLKESGIQPHDSALMRFIQGLFTGDIKDPKAVAEALDKFFGIKNFK